MQIATRWAGVVGRLIGAFIVSTAISTASAQEASKHVEEIIEGSLKGSEALVAEGVAKTIAASSVVKDSTQRLRKEARRLNTEGLTALNEKKFDAAIEAFAKAAVSDPLDQEVASNLGYAYMKKGDYAEAKKTLGYALFLSPDRSSTWATLAETFARAGDFERAYACFNLTYTFSQNQAKTLEYLEKIHASGDNALLTAAAFAARNSKGLTAIGDHGKEPSTTPAVEAAPTAAPTETVAPAAAQVIAPVPDPAPAPVAVAPQAAQAPAPTPNTETAPAPPPKPAPAEKPAKAADSVWRDLGKLLPFGIAIGAGFMWFRRKKQGRSEAPAPEMSAASPATDPAEASGKSFGRKAFEAAMGVAVGLVIIAVWQNYGGAKEDSPVEVSMVTLGGTRWNCSQSDESVIVIFPSDPGTAGGTAGTLLVNKRLENGAIYQNQTAVDFVSAEGKTVTLRTKGTIEQVRQEGTKEWVHVNAEIYSERREVEIALLTDRGMIASLGSEPASWRACNKLDREGLFEIAANAGGADVKRPGLPDLAKFERNLQQASSEKAKTAARETPRSSSTSDIASLAAQVDEGNVRAFQTILRTAEQRGKTHVCEPLVSAARNRFDSRAGQALQMPEGLPQRDMLVQMAMQQASIDVRMIREQCLFE